MDSNEARNDQRSERRPTDLGVLLEYVTAGSGLTLTTLALMIPGCLPLGLAGVVLTAIAFGMLLKDIQRV